jgi:hypothetical protein
VIIRGIPELAPFAQNIRVRSGDAVEPQSSQFVLKIAPDVTAGSMATTTRVISGAERNRLASIESSAPSRNSKTR